MSTTIAPVETPAPSLPEVAKIAVAPSQAAADLDAMLDLIKQGSWTRDVLVTQTPSGRINRCALGMAMHVSGVGY